MSSEAPTRVKLTTTAGEIIIEMFADDAPETVANFLQYVDDGFYDGTIFHRIIDGFMIQGGGFDAEMKQKATRDPVKNEADNKVSNLIGRVAMARTSDPHSASAQFFINVSDNTFLDHTAPTRDGWGYCVFGEVVEGMETVHELRQVPTGISAGMQDVPVDTVAITKAERIG